MCSSTGFGRCPSQYCPEIMAEGRDYVLSLGSSDQDGSAMSDFSGFESEEASGSKKNQSSMSGNKNNDVVTPENSKGKKGTKGPGKTKPCDSKKGKGKPSKSKDKSSSTAKKLARSNKQNKGSTSVFGVDNLSQVEILQLREILGFNNQEDEGPSVFDLYGPRPGNLTIECENDGPSSDVEIVPNNVPVRSLDKQVKDALFDNSSESKENEDVSLSNDEFSWQLPKLKAPKKGDAVSPSLASLINTACTSQCEVEIISKYKLPSNCDKMVAPHCKFRNLE